MVIFDDMVKSMNKKWEYKSEILHDVSEKFEEVPWIDKPQLQWDISVSWWGAAIADLQSQIDSLQSQIDSLDSRVTALWG